MASFQVISIRKPDIKSTHQDITHIMYYESQFNPRVMISVDDAIRRIGINNKEFYVKVTSGVIYLEVVKPEAGKSFLKTKTRYNDKDDLLRLQAC